ncbi:DNA cytosine methyltransferase [Fontibacillus phaseoli]|nr:DNA cytosine methyltransferase [Fontibacillus phaseoli]
MKPKVIDLFSGVGGMSLGFEWAGCEVVLANEYDKSIANAYVHNRKKTNMLVEDITRLPLKDTFEKYKGKIDIVIGGPPCQGFSQKGQRKTIHDERNFLFKYFFNVVELVRPKYFVMENVPNLFTSENGFFKNEIIEMFENIEYSLTAGILNAADYGVPQNRKRAVIIGKLGGIAPNLPEPVGYNISIWDAISDLAYLDSGEGEEEQEYRYNAQSEYQSMLRAGSKNLTNHVATNHSLLALERLSLIPPNSGKEVLPQEHLTKSIYSGTWTRMRKEEVSVTITTRFDTPSSGKFTHPFLNRAITVREAARIQSFPDTFKFTGNKGSQMKQVGNAVPPLLAKSIADVLLKDMRKEEGTFLNDNSREYTRA